MKLPLTLSKGLTQTAVTVGGNLFATGISSVALIIISRYLGPRLFGEFSVGFALIMIINKLNDFGLNTAIFAHIDHREPTPKINSVLNTILVVKLVFSVFIIGVASILYWLFGHLLGMEYPQIIILSIILSVVTTYFEHLVAAFQSIHLFYQAVTVYVTQSVAKFGIALLLMAQLKLGPLLTFSLYALAPLLSFLVAPLMWPAKFPIRLGDYKATIAKKTLSTAQHTAINYISQSLVDNVSIFFVQAYLTSYETGLLGGVSKGVLHFTLIASFLSQVLFPRVAKYTQRRDRSIYLKKATLLTIAVLLGTLLVLPFARLSILFTIGSDFLAGTTVLQILLLGALLQIAAVPFAALFFALRNFWYFTWSGLLQIGLLLIGNILVIPNYGLTGAAYVIVGTRLAIFILTLLLSLQLHFNKKDA
jgi:O-antigen/teichoic acid export membrane protein